MRNRLRASWSDSAKRPTLMLGFGAVGLAVVLLVIAISQLNPGSSTPTPTPTSECQPICPPAPQSYSPKVLHLRNRTISITPISVKKGDWVSSATEDQAEWVFGSVINYVIGLPATQQNNDMLQALSEADEITLDLSNGQTLSFRYAGRQFVSPTSTDIFVQTHPGLTLVQLGDNNNQRLVVTANYLPDESEVGKTVPSAIAQVNTPIEIGGVKVTVLTARLVANAPGVPVGSAFYLVDFTAENIGEDPIDASGFVIELHDYASIKYQLSKTASSLGPNSAPKGQIAPGLAATFMSGFEVPSNVTGPVLFWNFKPNASFTAQASVAVPLLGPTPTPDPRSKVSVQITQAYFTPDQSEMIIVGGIGNPTGAPMTISTADITLATPDGVLATLNSAEPPLPFNIGPGQNQTIMLHFSRLPGETAVLKIFLASFQLTLQ